MKTPHSALALALGLALAAGPALADSTASATIGNVQITLTDLDPNDGITPSLTINFGSQPYLNGAIGSYGPDVLRDGYAHLGKNASSTVTDSVQATYASSSATMVGANTLAGIGSIIVSGSAGSSGVGFGEFGALAANYTSSSFTLSANTAISISMDVTMSVQTTLGYDPLTGNLEHAQSHALLAFDGLDAEGNPIGDQIEQALYVEAAMDASGNLTGDHQKWSGSLSVSFSNASAQAIDGNFYSELGVGGSSITTAVPEPGSWALLLGGLGMVGRIARRRKAAAQG